MKCVIFDFDLTLFDSQSLEALRSRRQWKIVYEKLKECSFYPNAKNIIKQLREEGIQVAIVTNAPKSYIERALIFHHVQVDFVIAYHDVSRHKPDPEGIIKVLNYYSLESWETVYIGDNDIDHNSAINARIPFLGVEWGEYSKPNVQKINYTNFLEALHNISPL